MNAQKRFAMLRYYPKKDKWELKQGILFCKGLDGEPINYFKVASGHPLQISKELNLELYKNKILRPEHFVEFYKETKEAESLWIQITIQLLKKNLINMGSLLKMLREYNVGGFAKLLTQRINEWLG